MYSHRRMSRSPQRHEILLKCIFATLTLARTPSTNQFSRTLEATHTIIVNYETGQVYRPASACIYFQRIYTYSRPPSLLGSAINHADKKEGQPACSHAKGATRTARDSKTRVYSTLFALFSFYLPLYSMPRDDDHDDGQV